MARPILRPWPAAFAVLTSLVMPARTARRARFVGHRAAYFVHLGAALLTFLVVLFLVGLEDAPSPLSFWKVIERTTDVVAEMIQEAQNHPEIAILIVLGVFGFVELGFVLIGVLVSPWGAYDERMRSSLGHSLRLTWLHSGQFPAIVLLCGGLLVGLDRLGRHTFPPQLIATSWPTPPTPPKGNSTKALQDYQDAMAEYQQELVKASRRTHEAWFDYRRALPWYVRHAELIAFWLVCGFVSWNLTTLLRMIGARPPPVPIVRQPACEECGYDLTGISDEGRCPECGRPVRDSLGPQVRIGTLWQRRHESSPPVSWWSYALKGMSGAADTGRQLRTRRPGRHHRRFLAGFIPLVAMTGAIGAIVCAVSDDSFDMDRDAWILFGFVSPGFALFGVVLTYLVPMAVAVLAGMWHRYRTNSVRDSCRCLLTES